jgi:hypothetical protein
VVYVDSRGETPVCRFSGTPINVAKFARNSEKLQEQELECRRDPMKSQNAPVPGFSGGYVRCQYRTEMNVA